VEIADRETAAAALLGDTAARDYSAKLRQFNQLAEPELRDLIRKLHLSPGMRVLDAGCGTGEALTWLQCAVGEGGTVFGVDLAAAHVESARRIAPSAQIQQGDLLSLALPPGSLDLIWCVNTLNHLRDRVDALAHLKSLLRPRGRIALGQSSLLPDMLFAWDARLERIMTEAVRRYYRERYLLDEHDLTAIRSLVGPLREVGFDSVSVCTVVIERIFPLDPPCEAYLRDTIFRDTWGERLRPYMSAADFDALQSLCDPRHATYALRRPDFHFVQTFTLAVGGSS
jgi:SAM-dependent methyltransferase